MSSTFSFHGPLDRFFLSWLAALLALAALFAFPSAAEAQALEYEIHHLGELLQPAPSTSGAMALNHRGVAVGYVEDSLGDKRAVLWDLDRNGQAVAELLDPPCPSICLRESSFATDVNDHDEVVGYRSRQGVVEIRAAHWNARNSHKLPGSYKYSRSLAINNEGNIAGVEDSFIIVASGGAAAYRLHWDSGLHGDLMPGINAAVARDINDAGDVVGSLWENPGDPSRPFLFRGQEPAGGNPEELPLPMGYDSASAEAVNNHRVTVGLARVGGDHHAKLWRPDGSSWAVVDLHDPGSSGSLAFGVNDLGHAVGWQDAYGAFLWRDGALHDLNQLIPASAQQDWTLLEARDINDRGEIVGIGEYRGKRQAFLLTPRRSFDLYALNGTVAIQDGGRILAGASTINVFDYGSVSGVHVSAGIPGGIADDGRIAGTFDPGGTVTPTVWSESAGSWNDSSLPAGGDPCEARAISSAGHVGGHCWTSSGRQDALFWDEEGTGYGSLIPFSECRSSYFSAVNESGHAAGKCIVDPHFAHNRATRWSRRNGYEALFSSGLRGAARDLDSRGMVVGWEGHRVLPMPGIPQDVNLATFWAPGSTSPSSVGTLHLQIGSLASEASAVNDRRQIVGHERYLSHGRGTAYLWHQGAMVDLNLLLEPGFDWHLETAHDINDAGQILGTGYQPASATKPVGYVMTLGERNEEALRLCRGWCQPHLDCQEGGGGLWRPQGFLPFNGCVNGCLMEMLDPKMPYSLEEALAVRECFLDVGPELCSNDWGQLNESCCRQQGLPDCDPFVP